MRIVRDKAALDRRALVAECERWLKQSYYEITREWVYKGIVPEILVEELSRTARAGRCRTIIACSSSAMGRECS